MKHVIKVSQLDSRPEIRFQYNAALVKAVRALPGRQYHPQGTFRSIPEFTGDRPPDADAVVGYSVKSIQTLFHRACVKASIQKPARVHSLRHFMQATFWRRVPNFALSRSFPATAAARPRRFTPTFRPAPSQGSEVRQTTWRFPDGLPYNCWIQGDIRIRRCKGWQEVKLYAIMQGGCIRKLACSGELCSMPGLKDL